MIETYRAQVVYSELAHHGTGQTEAFPVLEEG